MSKTDQDSLQDHTLISAFNKVLILAQPLPLLACVCLHPFAPHYVLFCSVLYCNFAFLYAFLQYMLHHAPRFSHHLHHTPYTIHQTTYARHSSHHPDLQALHRTPGFAPNWCLGATNTTNTWCWLPPQHQAPGAPLHSDAVPSFKNFIQDVSE